MGVVVVSLMQLPILLAMLLPRLPMLPVLLEKEPPKSRSASESSALSVGFGA